MQRNKEKAYLVVLFLWILLLASCNIIQKETPLITVDISKNTTKLYFLNEEGNKIINEVFSLKMDTIEEQISHILTELEAILWTEEEKSLISDSNPIQGFIFNKETGVVTLYFASDYNFTHSITLLSLFSL